MADTLPNVELTPNTWTDIYDKATIPVGTQILIQNLGSSDIKLTTQATQPTDDDAFQICEARKFAVNEVGSTGEWAYSRAGGLINVRLVS